MKLLKRWKLEDTTPPHNKDYQVDIVDDVGKIHIETLWGRIGGPHNSGKPYTNLLDLSTAMTYAKGIVDGKVAKGYTIKSEEGPSMASPEASKPEEKKAAPAPTVYEEKQLELPRNKISELDEEAKAHVPVDEYYSDTGYLKPMVYGIKYNTPILLVGDTGCGKTASIRYLAGLTKNALRRVNLNGSTTVDEFVGKWRIEKGTMIWVDGILTECMRKGYWILCDEINAVLPEIAFVLHSVLDDDRMVVLTQKDGEILKAHPNFRFFGTMNPDYSGTHRLNAAFQDRFVVVEMDYPKIKDEVKILAQKTGMKDEELLTKMVKVAHETRKEFRNEKITVTFSTRKLIFWAEMCRVFTPAKAFKYAVLNKLPKEDVKPVMDIASIIFPEPEFRNTLTYKERE